MTDDLTARIDKYLAGAEPNVRRQKQAEWQRLLEASGASLRRIRSLLFCGANEERIAACSLLSALRHKASAPDILKVFVNQAEDREIRRAAAIALGGIGSRRATEPLIAALRCEPDIAVRITAASGLGFLGDPAATPDLLEVLANQNEEVRLRAQAAEACGNLMHPSAIPALVTALSDEAAEVRFWAAYALGETVRFGVISRLEELAAADSAHVEGWWSVGEEARDAINRIFGKEVPHRHGAVFSRDHDSELPPTGPTASPGHPLR